jgi:hypothetical protein
MKRYSLLSMSDGFLWALHEACNALVLVLRPYLHRILSTNVYRPRPQRPITIHSKFLPLMASTLRELVYLGVSVFWWMWTFAWVMYFSVVSLAPGTLIRIPPVEFPAFCIGMVVSAAAWIIWYMLRDLIPIPLPRWIAVRTPRYQRRDRIDTSMEHLCSSCRNTLKKSRLLNGTYLVLTRSVEWYEFSPIQEDNYGTFGPSCLLCNEFFSSMSWKTRSASQTTNVTLMRSSSFPSLNSSQTFSLRLKIWQPGDEEGKTYLQLQSSSGHSSHAFEASEGPASKHILRHLSLHQTSNS